MGGKMNSVIDKIQLKIYTLTQKKWGINLTPRWGINLTLDTRKVIALNNCQLLNYLKDNA
jgi:hypothetical protein